MWSIKQTHEGDIHFKDAGNPVLDFFGKAGSAFTGGRYQQHYYDDSISALDLYKEAWNYDKITSLKLMLWLRDCRGGAGNRSGFRSILYWMALNHPEWITPNIHWIPKVGRWDDLRSLYGTSLEIHAAELWATALIDKNVLAAKWADRNKDYPVRKILDMKIGSFRRCLANIRKDHIVEHKMCSKNWTAINYESIPSVAMSRYNSAFYKNDTIRFNNFKTDVRSGKSKVKASVLFPHDCVRNCYHGDREMADLQFEALPTYMPDDSMTMVITDTSGSMGSLVAGSIRAIDVSIGLGLYFSSKMDKEHPFYKRFIQFCSEGELVDWRGLRFSDAIFNKFDNAIGSTRIDLALDTILNIAKEKNIPQELMPDNLLIVSDMQFSEGTKSGESAIGVSLLKWDEVGYERPAIIYWNTDSYGGSPATAQMENVALISGFSPSILKAVLTSEKIDPMNVVNTALEKYSEIFVPRI